VNTLFSLFTVILRLDKPSNAHSLTSNGNLIWYHRGSSDHCDHLWATSCPMVVILGIGVVVFVVAGVLIFYQWSYWSSGRMELDGLTNSFLEEQAKYNLPEEQKIPLWRVEQLATEVQTQMQQNRIKRLTQDQVSQIMQDQEARWKTWLASPESKLETFRYYRKSLGNFAAFQLLKPEDKQLLRQHMELLTDEERRLLEQNGMSKPGS
jgi:hypothetical protein